MHRCGFEGSGEGLGVQQVVVDRCVGREGWGGARWYPQLCTRVCIVGRVGSCRHVPAWGWACIHALWHACAEKRRGGGPEGGGTWCTHVLAHVCACPRSWAGAEAAVAPQPSRCGQGTSPWRRPPAPSGATPSVSATVTASSRATSLALPPAPPPTPSECPRTAPRCPSPPPRDPSPAPLPLGPPWIAAPHPALQTVGWG